MDNGYDTLSKALDQIVALEARLAEARKDGEQYRTNWLALLNATGEECHLRGLEMINSARAAQEPKP